MVVIGRRNGHYGGTIADHAVSGGVNLLEGLKDYYDRHPTMTEIGFGAARTILTGGPVKTVVTRAANVAFDGAVDDVSNIAAERATPYLTDLTEYFGWSMDISIMNRSMSIGSGHIGVAGGQLTGAVVGTIMGDGLSSVVERGRNIRSFFDPIRRIGGRHVPNYRYAGRTFELDGDLAGK